MRTKRKGKTISKTKIKSKDKIVIYSKPQKDRLRRYNNNLLKANRGERITGRDIALTVMNYEEFYAQSFIPVAKMLARKKKRGTLDPELAKLSFYSISDNAIRIYKMKSGNITVNVRERTVIAQELYEDYYPEIAEGEYDYLIK